MNKTAAARKSFIDLKIIFITSLIVLTGFLVTMNLVDSSGGSSISGGDGAGSSVSDLLLQTVIGAVTQFGILGLGITIVCVIRKESFMSFGLKRDKLLPTIALSAFVCLPTLINTALTSGIHGYLPFTDVSFT